MMSRVVNMFSLRPRKHEGTGGATPSPKAASNDPRAATEAALHLPSLHRVEVDTRWLTYRVFGRALASGPTGVVLYFHGTPSCHIEAAVLAEHAEKHDVAVLSVDRPGIGGSTYQRRLSLTSFANDCNRLLDLLGVGRVIVVGCSGGGPYATAFAVLFPARARALGLLAPLAPTDWRRQRHRANLTSMGGFDKFQLAAARDPTALLGTPTLWLAHRALRYMAEKKPELLLEYVPKGMAAVDGDLMLHDPRIKGSFAAVLQHAYSGSGARGVVKDVNVLGRAWGLEACGVNCRTLIWQGSEDKSVPLTHAEWYASQIPGAKLVVLEGEGHVTLPVRHAALVLVSLLAAAEGRQLPPAPSLPVLSPEKEKELLVRVSLDQEAEAQQVLKGGAELAPADGEEGEDEGRGGRNSLIGRGGGSGWQ